MTPIEARIPATSPGTPARIGAIANAGPARPKKAIRPMPVLLSCIYSSHSSRMRVATRAVASQRAARSSEPGSSSSILPSRAP